MLCLPNLKAFPSSIEDLISLRLFYANKTLLLYKKQSFL
jgi:hypothetical protein